jgi:hypothetical protein
VETNNRILLNFPKTRFVTQNRVGGEHLSVNDSTGGIDFDDYVE